MSEDDLSAFVKRCRESQERLRAELKPYESGEMRLGEGPSGGPMKDITGRRISEIRAEIAQYERTVEVVAAAWEHGDA